MTDVLDQLSDEDRALYHSAQQVKRSEFWKYYVEKVEMLIQANKEEIVESTLRGDEKKSLIAASKVQGLRLAKEEMDTIFGAIEIMALNQEQEEQDADTNTG